MINSNGNSFIFYILGSTDSRSNIFNTNMDNLSNMYSKI